MKQLRSVDQDYIVWLEDYFIDYARREASIIMEFCNAGSMDKLILRHMQAGRRKIGESYIWAWFVQLAEALVWCHYGPEKGDGRRRGVWDMIYHRGKYDLLHFKTSSFSLLLCLLTLTDIKPANIFLHQYESGRYRGEIIAKLGDFGCATSYQRVITGRSSRQASGYTEGYRPPEAPLFNNKSDVWQAGAAIVCLCKLQHVPKPENVAMLFGPGGYYSSQLWECLAKCTESNWERRWDAKEMRRCLKGTYEGILKRGNLKTDGKPLLPGKATVM
jgi:NIMA (never in mitosis gene a)-related kinase